MPEHKVICNNIENIVTAKKIVQALYSFIYNKYSKKPAKFVTKSTNKNDFIYIPGKKNNFNWMKMVLVY